MDRASPILVGVSGGPDSLCLLDVLHRLAYPLVVAHMDHCLRPESSTEAQMVEGIARGYGLPFTLGREDVRHFSDAHSISIEEAARTVRYRFLFQQAQRFGAQAVAVGHTADDQVETLLMHLLRGSGLSGLRGMAFRSVPTAWNDDIPLVRPLLGISREEIVTYVADRGLEPVLDASNLDQTYYRNRLRHELIPFLESYNPQIRQNLWRTAQILSADYTALMQVVGEAWDRCEVEQGPGFVSFNVLLLRNEPVGIQRQLFRQMIAGLRPDLRDVGFEAVERGLALLASGKGGGQCDLVAGIKLLLEGDRAWVASGPGDLPGSFWPQIPAGARIQLNIPGSIPIPGGWEIQAEWVADLDIAWEQALAKNDPYQAWVDAGGLRLPLEVSGRRPGDRFQPFGLDGHSIKLSDYMINVKLPHRARAGWPLLRSGQEIVWVPGYRTSHTFRMTAGTRQAVHLRLFRSGEA